MSYTGHIGRQRMFEHNSLLDKQIIKPGTTMRFIRFALSYWRLLAIFLLVVVLDSSIVMANPLIYRYIINDGILKGNIALIVRLASLACLLGVIDGALGMLQSFLSAKIGATIVVSLRTRLFDHILRMPVAFFSNTQTGALIGRLSSEAAAAQNAFTDILSNVIGNLIVVGSLFSVMFVLSWQVALLALIVLPIFIVVARMFGGKLQQITQTGYHLNALMNNLMAERFSVSGALLAKLFGRPQDEVRLFEEKAESVAGIDVKRTMYGRLVFVIMSMTAVFATALTYGVGGTLAAQNKLDLGTVVALLSYLARLYMPFAGLSNIQVLFMTALVSFQRVFEIFDLEPGIVESPSAIPIPEGPAAIVFDQVSFRYPLSSDVGLASLQSHDLIRIEQNKNVLEEISFVAEAGKITAIVGPSGSGKTTITQLIARLYDPHKGTVAINGIDVRSATFGSIRHRVAFVTQDAHLFHDTIRANLLYAKPDATPEQLTEALRSAQILSLIASLPEGLDTIAGERGYRFSGGERQRLAIARVLLRDPEVVILDEATAHLDSESEAAIQRTFEVALQGRTSVVVAHRLSTILRAHHILVLNEGRIVERGMHNELIRGGGLYAALYKRQFDEAGSVLGAELVV